MLVGAAVSLDGLAFSYGRGQDRTQVLRHVDLDLAEGDYLSLMGASGAGKSTLLGLIGGLIPSAGGMLRVGGRDVSRLGRRGLAEYRRSTVGFVFQHYGLVDVLTARENVELALALARAPRRGRRERAGAALERVALSHRAAHLPHQLSGGEAQRVAIARALVNDPQILLADEPTGNLDELSTSSVLELMEAHHNELGCTLVIVTHNSEVAERATHQARLDDGALIMR